MEIDLAENIAMHHDDDASYVPFKGTTRLDLSRTCKCVCEEQFIVQSIKMQFYISSTLTILSCDIISFNSFRNVFTQMAAFSLSDPVVTSICVAPRLMAIKIGQVSPYIIVHNDGTISRCHIIHLHA